MQTAKKRRHLRAAMVIPLTLALVFTTGCATLINPAIQNIPVTTHPDGGEVWVDGELVGTAPITLKLDTRKNHDITVRRGDDIRTWTLKQQMSMAGGFGLAGDVVVLVPGLVGAALGFAAGSRSGGWFTCGSLCTGLGLGSLVVGLTPLAVDTCTNKFYELQPGELMVEFE